MKAEELRTVNGSFGLACHISGDDLDLDEVQKLTDRELKILCARIDNRELKRAVEKEIKDRKC